MLTSLDNCPPLPEDLILEMELIERWKEELSCIGDKKMNSKDFNELRYKCPWCDVLGGNPRCRALYDHIGIQGCVQHNCALMYWLSQGSIQIDTEDCEQCAYWRNKSGIEPYSYCLTCGKRFKKEDSLLDLIKEFGLNSFCAGQNWVWPIKKDEKAYGTFAGKRDAVFEEIIECLHQSEIGRKEDLMEEDKKEDKVTADDILIKLEIMRMAANLVVSGAGENAVHVYRDMLAALKEN